MLLNYKTDGQKLIQILKIDESEIYAKVYEAVKDLNESGYIVTETEEITDEETQSIHYLSSLLLAEESCAAKMQELLNTELEIDMIAFTIGSRDT